MGQHADLEPEGGAGLLIELGHRSPLPVLAVARVRHRLSGMGPTMGEDGGLEGNCGILPRKTKRGSSAGFLSEMSPNFGEKFFLESCLKAVVVAPSFEEALTRMLSSSASYVWFPHRPLCQLPSSTDPSVSCVPFPYRPLCPQLHVELLVIIEKSG